MQESQHGELQRWIEQHDLRHVATSAWSIGQQIEHCCRVTVGVHSALQASVPPAPRARISMNRFWVFTTGTIPRGRAQAPARVRPEETPTAEQLQAFLDDALTASADIRVMQRDAWFRHFAFDVLRRDEALKFLRIHTNHHLRIVRLIARRATGATSPHAVE